MVTVKFLIEQGLVHKGKNGNTAHTTTIQTEKLDTGSEALMINCLSCSGLLQASKHMVIVNYRHCLKLIHLHEALISLHLSLISDDTAFTAPRKRVTDWCIYKEIPIYSSTACVNMGNDAIKSD